MRHRRHEDVEVQTRTPPRPSELVLRMRAVSLSRVRLSPRERQRWGFVQQRLLGEHPDCVPAS